MMRLFLLTVCWLCLVAAGRAQQPGAQLAGRSPVRDWRTEKWQTVRSGDIEVSYTEQQLALAQQAARLGRQAYYELSYFLGYSLRQRMLLQLYASRGAYTQHHAAPQAFLPSKNYVNIAAIYFPGTHQTFYEQIRGTVARAMVEEMYYGGGGQLAFQNRVLLYLPEWYLTGLTSYLGSGWTVEDEMRMRSLDKKNFRPYVLSAERSATHLVIKKSVWHYIERKFGRKKIAELVYMVRLARNVEGAVQAVLGMSMKRLTDQWELDAMARYQPEAPAGYVASQPIPGLHGAELIGLAHQPETGELAYLSAENGVFRLHFYQPQTGRYRRGHFRAGSYSTHPAYQQLQAPMDWHAGSNRIYFSLPANGENRLYVYDVKSQTTKALAYDARLDAIYDLAVRPDGQALAISALRGGQVDLYISSTTQLSPTPITQDGYDDRYPVWDASGKGLYFSSNRGFDVDRRPSEQKMAHAQPLNVYRISNYVQWEQAELVQYSQTYSEHPLEATASGVFIHTSYSGLLNLAYYDWETYTYSYLSDERGGLQYLWQSQGQWWGLVWAKGKPQVVQLPPMQPGQNRTPMRNAESLHWEALKERREQLIAQLAAREEARKALEDSIEIRTDAPPDTARAKVQPAIRYYLFDEADEPKPETRKPRPSSPGRRKQQPRAAERLPPELFEADTVRVNSPQKEKIGPLMRGASMNLLVDPYAGFGIDIRILLEDAHQYHRAVLGFTPYVDFRSSNLYGEYQFLKYRIQPYVRLDRQARYFENPRAVTMLQTRGETGIRIPLREDLTLGLGGGYSLLQRRDLDLLDFEDLDARESLLHGQLSLIYDHTQRVDFLTLTGTHMQATAQHYQSASEGTIGTTLQGSIAQYHTLFGILNLAGRLSGGVSTGPQQQQFMLGGVQNWLLPFEFANKDDIPLDGSLHQFALNGFATPLQGFAYNARNGYQYLVGNAELRIPLSRLANSTLHSNPLYNVQAVLFYNMGTAWRTGNPFSQRNPIDASVIERGPISATVRSLKVPFIQSFGVGFRTLIVGYFTSFELGWPIEENELLNPQFSVSFGKEF